MPASISRAQFLRRMLGGAAAAGLVPVLACADDPARGPDAAPLPVDAAPVDAPTDAPPNCLANGTNAAIAQNHGHHLEVTIADITAGAAMDYDIQGAADHTHSLSLSQADYAALRLNQPVVVTSSSSGHSHVVTVSCG